MDPPTGKTPTRTGTRSRAPEGGSSACAGIGTGPISRLPSGEGRAPDSTIETYVAVRIFVDTWRWAGVPIYIRAGKCMPLTAAEVTVEFKAPPRSTFGDDRSANYLRARLARTSVLLWVCG